MHKTWKSIKIIAATVAVLFSIFLVSYEPVHEPIILVPAQGPLPMPLVLDTNPLTANKLYGDPRPQRDVEYREYLCASLKISVSGASGSGTIVYYDHEKNEAYVASCGHLWSGSRDAKDIKSPVTCKVITWYHNDEKLKEPKSYPAEVLFWSNNSGFDTSLLKFKPDWVPNYFPIAPEDYKLEEGMHLHSCGCDHAEEVAHYDVEVVGYEGKNLVTKLNSPRPGRSGGGLMSDDGFYVGTCWGTSDTSGNGVGYFTTLKAITTVYTRNDYKWLLEVGPSGVARQIPMRRWSRIEDFDSNKIPMPGRGSLPAPLSR